jgi:DNA-binding transcriptional regulator YiaG
MKYELFVILYSEALEYSDLDMYIAERGWQDWMNNFDEDKIGDLLSAVYDLAHKSLKDLRQDRNISRAAFSRLYKIPIRTLEHWDAGTRKIADYTKMLIAYTLFMEDLLDVEK